MITPGSVPPAKMGKIARLIDDQAATAAQAAQHIISAIFVMVDECSEASRATRQKQHNLNNILGSASHHTAIVKLWAAQPATSNRTPEEAARSLSAAINYADAIRSAAAALHSDLLQYATIIMGEVDEIYNEIIEDEAPAL